MTRPFLLGLTGSIGMGKSTTAAMFAAEGLPVWDADATVHRLYAPGGAAVQPIAALCPGAVRDGAVDRQKLKDWIATDQGAIGRIEAVVHPLVAADRAAFIAKAAETGTDIVVLDVPLLFETGGDRMVDATVVVTAPADVQRARVLARPAMTETQFATILQRQIPDSEKRARATYVIGTETMEGARDAVREVIVRIRKTHA
ncbi:MAG: dephospho-CoA kinase [Rhodobacteraceae bacterium]|nr:dephospho-CoA kinase [Paracoccaceae bacterium]